jgi:hypothetical protein
MNSSPIAPAGPGGTSDPAGVIAVAGEALMDLVPAGTPRLFEVAPGRILLLALLKVHGTS